MPDLRHLYDLTGQVQTPELNDLARLAERRRRRAGASMAAAVVAGSILTVALLTTVGGDRGTGPEPARPPTPAPSPTLTFAELSAQEIKDHPDATPGDPVDLPATAADVAARVWSVCLDECTRATEHLPGERQSALEVSDDGFSTGSLYLIDGSENISHAVDEWYFVDGSKGPALVDPHGHRRRLQAGESVPVTEVAGPLVYAGGGVAYINMPARTLHVIEGDGFWDWQGAADAWFWGVANLVKDSNAGTTVTRHVAVWRDPNGVFAVKVLPIGDSRGGPGMLRANTPGTMAVVEHYASPRLAHISTDYGSTWQIRVVPSGVPSGGTLPDTWATWPTD